MSMSSAHVNPRDLDRTLADPPDPASIMLLAVALVGLGVTMIYSASADLGDSPITWRFWTDPGLRQLVFVLPALGLMWAVSHLPYRVWRLWRFRPISPVVILMLVSLALLVGVLLAPASIAPEVNGAKRWFKLGGGFSLQPSELAKLTLVLALAALLSDTRFKARRFLAGMVPLVVLIGLVVLLVIKEDFGTAFLIALVAGCMLLAGGTRFWQLLLFIPPAATAGILFIVTNENRMERVRKWWTGGEEHYQIKQSLMAIASGDWYGRGLGDGIQKFYYLPEGTTDFIYANLCEELGLVGGLIVIGLFVMLLWQLRRAMATAPDALGQLIVLGVMLVIGLQAAMNIGVVSGALPPKGIALPFISAGGSGLVIMSVALGIAASVARTARRELGVG